MTKKIFYIMVAFFVLESAGFYQNASANLEDRKIEEDTEKASEEQENLDSPWDPRGN